LPVVKPQEQEIPAEILQDLPAWVDWRTKGMVVAVKDQGGCGSCWTFSATGSMEGAHAFAGYPIISLSEQLIVDCAETNHLGCSGGWMDWAFQYVIGPKNGSQTEFSYPYLATDGHSCNFNYSEVRAQFSGYVDVDPGNETALTYAAAARPGVAVAIDASTPSFAAYKSGVFSDPTCQNGVDDLDHAVLVVGYGVDETSGKEYYLVKNSWGTNWGETGYIRMSRNNNNNCGIATKPSYILSI